MLSRTIPAALIVIALGGACAPAAKTQEQMHSLPPLPAPDGLRLWRVPIGAMLKWEPVAGVDSYRVSWVTESGTRGAFSVNALQLLVEYPKILSDAEALGSDVTFSVEGVAPGRSAHQSSLIAPSKRPKLAVELTGRAAVATWDSDEPAVVVHGLFTDSVQTVGASSSGTLVDSSIQEHTDYDYEVVVGGPQVFCVSDTVFVSVFLFPPENVVVGEVTQSDFRVAWDKYDHADGYAIVSRGSADAGWQKVTITTDTSSNRLACGFQQDHCWVAVESTNSAGFAGHPSVPIHVFLLPEMPLTTVVSQVDSVRVDVQWWPSRAERLIVERAEQADGGFQPVGVTTGLEFIDTDAPLWNRSLYRVRAVSDGGVSTTGLALAAMATEPADQMNLDDGTAEYPGLIPAGQSFTAGRGGQLRAVELQVAPGHRPFGALRIWSGGTLLADGVSPSSEFGDSDRPLVASEIRGAFYDLADAGVQVSDGATLEFELVGEVMQRAESYGRGSQTSYGSIVANRDLVFKTFVQSPARLTAPVLSVSGGYAAAFLEWSASPAAVRYDMYRSEQGNDGVLVASTSDLRYLDVGLTPGSTHEYVVAGVGADGIAIRSSTRLVTITPYLIDQEKTGDTSTAFYVAACAGSCTGASCPAESLGQSITVQSTGQLSAIELAASGSDQMRLDVSVNGGPPSVPVPPSSGRAENARLRPLQSNVPTGVLFDLSALGIEVTPGTQLQVRLTLEPAPPSVPCVSWRSTNTGSGGTRTKDGQVSIAADFAFRTLVR